MVYNYFDRFLTHSDKNVFPIRIVFVLQDLEFGGTQKQVLALASNLDFAKFKVELWVMRSGGGFYPFAKESGVPIKFLSSKTTVGLSSVITLWRMIFANKFDVLVPFTAVPNIWCRLFGKISGAPIIIGTCRGGGSIHRQKEKFLWKLAHHHICNSVFLKDALVKQIKIPTEKITLIENGVYSPTKNMISFRDRTPQKKILSIGRLVEDKDHGTLIRAFAIVTKTHPDAQLTIIGDGHLLGDHKKLAKHLQVSTQVNFVPGQSQVSQYYEDSDIFVLSSATEASPNVIMEASMASLPVVATDVGGVSQLVVNNETGFLVPKKSPEMMAESVLRLLADAPLCSKMGKQGAEFMKMNFGVERMVAQYEAIIIALTASRLKKSQVI